MVAERPQDSVCLQKWTGKVILLICADLLMFLEILSLYGLVLSYIDYLHFQIMIWDPKTGAQIGKTLLGHKQWITSLAWEPLHKDEQSRCV